MPQTWIAYFQQKKETSSEKPFMFLLITYRENSLKPFSGKNDLMKKYHVAIFKPMEESRSWIQNAFAPSPPRVLSQGWHHLDIKGKEAAGNIKKMAKDGEYGTWNMWPAADKRGEREKERMLWFEFVRHLMSSEFCVRATSCLRLPSLVSKGVL